MCLSPGLHFAEWSMNWFLKEDQPQIYILEKTIHEQAPAEAFTTPYSDDVTLFSSSDTLNLTQKITNNTNKVEHGNSVYPENHFNF